MEVFEPRNIKRELEQTRVTQPWGSRLVQLIACSSLMLVCLLLVVPKLIMMSYGRAILGIYQGPKGIAICALQDMALAVGIGCALLIFSARLNWRRLIVGYAGTGALLLLLLVDCRVRELWLQPLTLSLAWYGWDSRQDLVSGVGVFLNEPAGLGLTMLQWTLLVGAAHFVAWAGVALALSKGHRPFQLGIRMGSWSGRTAFTVAAGVIAASLGVAAIWVKPYVYQVEENILISPLVNLARSRGADPSGTTRGAEAFEQEAFSVNKALRPPRRILEKVAPFRNLVLVMFESVRWKGMNLDADDSAPTPVPELRALARQGTLARCYVSLPHSCKSYYAILTGRHPWPGLEMMESLQPRNDSLIWTLASRGGGTGTYCFSSMSLEFEHLGGLLKSLGIERREQMGLDPTTGKLSKPMNSFGGDDQLLLESIPTLKQESRPFAAVYLPLAAHYPYSYPDKPDSQGATFEAYVSSAKRADGVLGRLLKGLEQAGLLQDTLVVVIGDHGESFGEHGTTIHDNSMYEEEITSPLVLWSADGRMRHQGTLTARQIDIAPTILDLMGMETSALKVQGESVLRMVGGPSVVYTTSFFSNQRQARIENGRKIIYSPTTKHMIRFDLASDPDERNALPIEDEGARMKLQQQFDSFTAYVHLLFGH